MRVGVDIGGTFTDLITLDAGRLRLHKLPSTPDNPAKAMLDGLAHLAGGLERVTQVAHGSTVATNAILERKGARTAFITTEGFRDLLWIGRQNRPDLYALYPQITPPLIARADSFEVSERLDHEGNVLLPLTGQALGRLAAQVVMGAYESIAVCLLYSFRNPTHEKRLREALVATGAYTPSQIVLSHEVLPEFREYERASTTAMEAYVRPKMSRYIGVLRQKLPPRATLHVMKSDGGLLSAEAVQQRAAHTALSGPAAGVIGALHLARLAGFERIMTLDIGGTSTDAALCVGDVPLATHQQIDGLPLRLRMLDIETIGAGGGSLARVDAGGSLRVGPQSAGAHPGPVAYGRGGTTPTVTDANVVLGRIDPASFLGGRMALDVAAAERALAALGAQIGRDAAAMAQGVIDVVNAHISRALRRVSIERGHDPREFTLVAFGGAGPLHACEVAAELGIPLVLVPPHPGVMCALGLLIADLRVDISQPVMELATTDAIARLRGQQAVLMKQGRLALLQEGVAEAEMRFEVSLDMRYHGQAHELNVPLAGAIVRSFHRLHEQAYGYALPERPVEIVTMRLRAVGALPVPTFAPQPAAPHTPEMPVIDGVRRYARAELRPGARLVGPAVITQEDATTYLPVGWEGVVDGYHNLQLGRAPFHH
ncbi:hydantoinase/oxoprolinase family protein [Aggregatilineales bacterium SYSU G02658]